ncbi:MAG: Lipopolysaccharide biosynthesis protein [Thermotoga sp. 50_1627]|nr:MAG: Lipopolysaccharide biosynthesis protein [Thermotoga sp. 50_64]KUK24029.1 MAG: Lipopolysaccharide biosynthesis protein [Thermotoga sp. 50_1627]HBT39080.1 UDP-N-acetylglucosamine 2-epimerase (non-hydrolyzing) [Pseudothermotoga sp.]HCO98357.1 UDP-N-acetylglucosamine 2-epimerase (non-hydrolyzing) [Pseudothermotoga sp.]
MKVLSLVGARPQIIKEAVLHEAFKSRGIREILVHSGQHYDRNMSDVFFEVLNIREPDYNLNAGSGKHGEMTGKIMIEFEKVVEKEKPDIIVVYGDTNTTLAGAIVGAKLKIPVAHVEAGIRQQPKDMPEEINRILTDHVSKLLFCPSQLAVENLKKEGITNGVHFVGDVMYDLFKKMESRFSYESFEKLNLKENRYIVLTLHRDFNVDHKEILEKILRAVSRVSERFQIVFPIHPRTKNRVKEFGLQDCLKGVTVIEPVDYLNLMGLVKKCHKVITDSGGLQKEAYFAGKRAIVLMPDTGWRELVEAGWNRLASADNLLDLVLEDEEVEYPADLYGNGDSAQKIVGIISSFSA